MNRKSNPVCGLFCCLLLAFAPVVNAQKPALATDAVPAALTQKVHLDLDSATVKQALVELSAQCKIQIAASDYLEDRVLSLHLANISASDALDTIAEGNDWIWYAENDTTIRMTRPRILTPQSLAEVPAAFKATLPKDMRRYLGYEAAPLGLVSAQDKKDLEIRATFPKNARGSALLRSAEERSARLNMSANLFRRLFAVRLKQQKPFEQMLFEETRNRFKIPYAQLTSDQKQALINVMVCATLARFSSDPTTFHFFHNSIPREMFDPSLTVISVKNNRITIGHSLNGRIYGYDEGLQSEKDLGDPLRLNPNRY